MSFRIELSPKAIDESEEVFLWIREHSGSESAARWYAGLFRAMRTLNEEPTRCHLAREAAVLGMDIRQLLYGDRRSGYRILFVVRDDCVLVLHIRHGARRSLTRREVRELLDDTNS
jgi:plasmid stabilization system protein ParE